MILGIPAGSWLLWWAGVAVKAALVLALAGAVATLCRKAQAAVRQRLWMVALLIAALLPLVELAGSWWRPWAPWPPQELASPTAPASAVSTPAWPASMVQATADRPVEPLSASAATMTDSIPLQHEPPTAVAPSRSSAAPARRFDFRAAWQTLRQWLAARATLLLSLWLGGAVLSLLPWVIGHCQALRLASRAGELRGGIIDSAMQRACDRLTLRRPVPIKRSRQIVTPMTVGVLRPMILMPSEAWNWPTWRLEMALFHELMHAKRRDCLWLLLGRVVCAIYWFNPLTWWALAQLRQEQELSCDAFVVSSGHAGADYAQWLVELARQMKSGWHPASLPLVRADLKTRVQAILSPPRMSRGVAAGITVALCGLLLGSGTALACLQIAPQPQRQLLAQWFSTPAVQARLARPARTAALEKVAGDQPTQRIDIDPRAPWWRSTWAGNLHTECALRTYDAARSLNSFQVLEPHKRSVWVYNLAEPIDWHRYPIVVLRYRVQDVGRSGHYLLWLDDGTGPNGGGRRPFTDVADVLDDGLVHEIRRDIRELDMAGQGTVTGLALGVAADELPATFELLSLGFETAPDSEPAALPRDADQELLRLRVVDVQGRPLSAAQVLVDTERQEHQTSWSSDEQGWVTASVPRRQSAQLVHVTHAGYTPLALHVWAGKLGSAGAQVILHRSATLGGQVVDEQGQPIEACLVRLVARQAPLPGDDHVLRRAGPFEFAALTDANGRFRVDQVPVDCGELSVQLAHADYLSDRRGDPSVRPTLQELRQHSARCVMRRGLTVRGVVVNTSGQPVAKAAVSRGTQHRLPTTQTDEQGQFVFRNVPAGELVLTVRANPYGPALHRSTITQDVQDLRLELSEPHTVRFRVVDAQGLPIHRATVSASTWRGLQTLDFFATTQADGRYRWALAPQDQVTYNFSAQDHMSVRGVPLLPAEQEHVIVLPPALRVSGKVTDAGTGAPIERFEVIPGFTDADQSLHWDRRNLRMGIGGQYQIALTYPRASHLLRVEAPGYAPALSRPLANDEGAFSLDLQLRPEPTRELLINQPDGSPAIAASVYVVTADQPLLLENGQPLSTRSVQRWQADERGRARLSPLSAPFRLVVTHDAGYAEVGPEDLSKSDTVALQPWCQIEGVLKIGPKTGADAQVRSLYQHGSEPLRYQYVGATQTDASGRFVLQRVPPGPTAIAHFRPAGHQGWGPGIAQRRDLKPGETWRVQVGGSGRAVVGKVVLADAPHGLNFADLRGHHALLSATPTGPNAQHVHLALNPDGSFRIDDVPPGDYQLSLTLQQLDPAAGNADRLLGVVHRSLAVSDGADPLDLGDLPAVMPQRIDLTLRPDGSMQHQDHLLTLEALSQLIQSQSAPVYVTVQDDPGLHGETRSAAMTNIAAQLRRDRGDQLVHRHVHQP